MAIRKIAQLGEPVLRVPARRLDLEEILSPRIRTLTADMIETMREANYAVDREAGKLSPARAATEMSDRLR